MNTANLLRQRNLQRRWHRHQSKRHILRSQLGFDQAESTCPKTCYGCKYYHGIAYGQGRDRALLICAFHPYGWLGQGHCPDWCSEDEVLSSQPQ